MAKHGWKWQKMAGNDWKVLEMAGLAENAGNVWKWLESAGMAGKC